MLCSGVQSRHGARLQSSCLGCHRNEAQSVHLWDLVPLHLSLRADCGVISLCCLCRRLHTCALAFHNAVQVVMLGPSILPPQNQSLSKTFVHFLLIFSPQSLPDDQHMARIKYNGTMPVSTWCSSCAKTLRTGGFRDGSGERGRPGCRAACCLWLPVLQRGFSAALSRSAASREDIAASDTSLKHGGFILVVLGLQIQVAVLPVLMEYLCIHLVDGAISDTCSVVCQCVKAEATRRHWRH